MQRFERRCNEIQRILLVNMERWEITRIRFDGIYTSCDCSLPCIIDTRFCICFDVWRISWLIQIFPRLNLINLKFLQLHLTKMKHYDCVASSQKMTFSFSFCLNDQQLGSAVSTAVWTVIEWYFSLLSCFRFPEFFLACPLFLLHTYL